MILTDKNIDFNIKMVKYEAYIKKHPHKPYGYYCMGVLYFKSCDYNRAEEFFKKAVFLDKQYIRGYIGLIAVYTYKNKFLKAVKIYNKYKNQFTLKNVYKVKIARIVSQYYTDINYKLSDKGFFSSMYFKYMYGRMIKTYKMHTDNLVAAILICIYDLSFNEKLNTSIYNDTASLKGITNELRWALIKKISKQSPEILNDIDIALKFNGIPCNNCNEAYINMIFKTVISCGNIKKIRKIYKSKKDIYKVLSPSNMWKYIYFCYNQSIVDDTIYQCCRKLIRYGWIDKYVVNMFNKIEESGMIKDGENEKNVISLYGYIN